MNIQTIRNQKRTVALYWLIIFITMCIVFLLITMYAQSNTDLLQRSEIEINERNLVDVEKTIASSRINMLVSDLLYILDTMKLAGVKELDYTAVEQLWVAFSNRKGVYDQIRYLDTDGNEVIRVNNVMGLAIAEKKSMLQNKKDRYYFQDTISLRENEVYISMLDLNVENGRIEVPIKPMLRLGTPYFDSDGELRGIIVLNYTAYDLLERMDEIASSSHGDVFLLNMDGYWLYNGADSGKEWAFMYEDRLDESFAAEFPDEWAAVTGSENGYFNTENGVFSFTRLIPKDEIINRNGVSSVLCRSGPLYIVSYVASDSRVGALLSENIWSLGLKVMNKYVIAYPAIALFALILAVLFAINKSQNQEIKYFSEFDAMTGVYNRRAGYGKLNALKKDASRKDCKAAICFIDINGLKEVNDRLGHDAGDELIQSAVGVIKENVRGNDFIARLGGDEFLIVYDNLDAEGAEKVWARIVQKYDRINAEENRKYIISVSHGVGTFACNAGTSVDAVVNQADAVMYREKREIKRNFHVIRDME